MSSKSIPKEQDISSQWAGLVSRGIENAIGGLSQMVGQDIQVSNLLAKTVAVKDTPALLGGSETLSVAIYLAVSGYATGHMIIVYQPHTAFEFVDLLLGNPTGTTHSLGEMEESVLGEMGNIMGSFFLNSLADATGLNLNPSPPAVMMDMVGAVLDVALGDIMQETDEALIVEATFGTRDRQINGTFLVMPSVSMQKALLEHWVAQ